jgi:glycosyltransferase involved in cell wall biosynthesis
MPPLVSIFNFCKDRKQSIRRCIESILNQSYKNLEIIIQDGASTDGTLEIIQSYHDDRIKLVSRPDSGPPEAFWTALKRCTGDYIGSCLSDEEMLPQSVEEAVKTFEKNPGFGGICRDMYLMDENGEIKGLGKGQPFLVHDYLSGIFTPHFATAFFRRSSLENIGLYSRNWHMDCGEYELWCRLGLAYPIAYKPGFCAKYASHTGQLSRDPTNIVQMFWARARVLKELFNDPAYPQLYNNERLRLSCTVSNGLGFADYLAKTCQSQTYAEEILKYCQKLAHVIKKTPSENFTES